MDEIIPDYQQYFNNENYQFDYYTYKQKFKNDNEYPMVLGDMPVCQNIITCNDDVWEKILNSDSSALDELRTFRGKYSDGKLVLSADQSQNGDSCNLEDVKTWLSRDNN